jgi:hypothetical protein
VKDRFKVEVERFKVIWGCFGKDVGYKILFGVKVEGVWV